MLWNREDAEDATQEILVRAVTRLSQFDFRSRLKTWVYRLAVNYIHSRRQKESARTAAPELRRFADDLADGLAAAEEVDAEPPDATLLSNNPPVAPGRHMEDVTAGVAAVIDHGSDLCQPLKQPWRVTLADRARTGRQGSRRSTWCRDDIALKWCLSDGQTRRLSLLKRQPRQQFTPCRRLRESRATMRR